MRVDLLLRHPRDPHVLLRAARAYAQALHAHRRDAALAEELDFVLVQRVVVRGCQGNGLHAKEAAGPHERRAGGDARHAGLAFHEVGQRIERQHERAGGAGIGHDIGRLPPQLPDGDLQVGVQCRGIRVQRHAHQREAHARRRHALPFRLVDGIGRRNDQAQPSHGSGARTRRCPRSPSTR